MMILSSVLNSYCVCRRPSWKSKTQPNGSSAVVWLSFWFSTRFTRKIFDYSCVSYLYSILQKYHFLCWCNFFGILHIPMSKKNVDVKKMEYSTLKKNKLSNDLFFWIFLEYSIDSYCDGFFWNIAFYVFSYSMEYSVENSMDFQEFKTKSLIRGLKV